VSGIGSVASRRASGRREGIDLSAPQLLVGSFAALILTGTAGFLVLPGLWHGERASPIDALFMATSAVCVTGLAVLDVSTRLTFFGQLWLLLLVQLGGLGILTFAALAARAIGQRASLQVEEAVAGPASLVPSRSPMALVRAIVVITLVVEACGAAVLWALWRDDLGLAGAVWPAVFHAVSAFCNAGFSLFRDNLVAYAGDAPVLLTVAGLIVVGGIGFPVLEDVRLRLAGRRRRLFVHTRLVLATTAVLVVGSSLLYLALEWHRALAAFDAPTRLAHALFLAITPRTAGFNAVDYDRLANPSVLLTIALMWIGGAPASTAGGVKVTTAALLFLVFVSKLRGRRDVVAGNRTLPDGTIQRAIGLAAGAVALLVGAVFVLLWTEVDAAGAQVDRGLLIRLLFEAQSALGTVGLSMNQTTQLSPVGRLVIVGLMFAGRVGPLALIEAMIIRASRRSGGVRLAREDVLVG